MITESSLLGKIKVKNYPLLGIWWFNDHQHSAPVPGWSGSLDLDLKQDEGGQFFFETIMKWYNETDHLLIINYSAYHLYRD